MIDDKEVMVMFFRKRPGDDIGRDMITTRRILGLDLDAHEFRVVYGTIAADNKEIAILTRSMLQIMLQMGSYIDVPVKDIREGRTFSPSDEGAPDMPPLIQVKSDTNRPKEAFVDIFYENNWFWIDATDTDSKRTFLFLMLLFSLTEAGGKAIVPIVTVPTN